MSKDLIKQAMSDLNLTVESTFIPWTKSRNYQKGATIHERTLNWKIMLKRDGREVITTDYSAGIAHAPSYSLIGVYGSALTLDAVEALAVETETGRAHHAGSVGWKGRSIEPDSADVVASLVLDASAIDHPTFEDWADSSGYDRDSRKAEAAYRGCLEIGLKLRAALGEAGLTKLRTACEDY